jgi:restriction endonuclease S subunit
MSSEWRLTTVEEIAAPHPTALATGPFGSAISSKFFVASGVPVIRGSNLSTEISTRLIDDGLVFISTEKAEEFQRSEVRRGDLIFTCWGTINQVGLIDAGSKFDRYIISNKQMKLSVDSAKADRRFIYYLFSGPDKQAEILDNGIGSSVPGFNLGQLKRHEFWLPPLMEQRGIADFLGLLDDRISLLRETNATLESIAQALFKSWFIDFDPVCAKMEGRVPEGMDEAAAALFPDSFEESELGLVPRGWRIGSLGSELKIAYGKNLPTKKLLASGYPVYGGNGQIGYFDKFIYETRQVLIACRGAASGKVNQSARKAFVTNNSLVLESDESTNLPFGYIKGYMLNSDLTGFVTGSAQPQVTIDNLKVFKLLVPCASVLRAFESLSSVFENRIEENDRQIICLAELRDALLPRLISGQLRLPEIEEMVTETS